MAEPAFYTLGTPDLPARHEAWLLRERHPAPDGPPRLRACHRPLACRKCGRVDELAALAAGVSPDFRAPPAGLDAVTTGDHFLVVTRRAHEALLAVPSLEVHAFDVPAAPGHVVLFPKRQFHPPADAPVYTPVEPPRPGEAFQVRGRRCPGCGRVRQMTFWPRWFAAPPDVVLAAAMVELPEGVAPDWVASQRVVDEVRRAGLTGSRARPLAGG